MFRVKICGITSVPDGLAAAEAGASAIGLNFWPGSPRYCAPDAAAEIVRALPSDIMKVGVFVNASAEEVRNTAARVGLNLVQLHGDEPPSLLRDVRPLPVMRAVRAELDLGPVEQYLRECRQLQCVPRMLLVDAAAGAQFGGTGKTLDWRALADGRRHLLALPLVLAGGLNPANVAEAISIVRPWAVDVASGVEDTPGRKSPSKMRAFVAAALAAFQQLTSRHVDRERA